MAEGHLPPLSPFLLAAVGSHFGFIDCLRQLTPFSFLLFLFLFYLSYQPLPFTTSCRMQLFWIYRQPTATHFFLSSIPSSLLATYGSHLDSSLFVFSFGSHFCANHIIIYRQHFIICILLRRLFFFRLPSVAICCFIMLSDLSP